MRFLILLFALLVAPIAAHAVPAGPVPWTALPGFSVRSYGAKCDGTTDDSAAIQAAVAAATNAPGGASVLFPDGAVCAVNSGITATQSQNAGLIFHANGMHGVSLLYPANFTGIGINVTLAAPSSGAFFSAAGLTFLHGGTDTDGTALRVTETSGVQDPSIALDHIVVTSRTSGSFDVGIDLRQPNVTYLTNPTCFFFHGSKCVSYDSTGGAVSVEHHITGLYVNGGSTTVGLSIGHPGMTDSLQGFTVHGISCTGIGTCISATGATDAIDQLIVEGGQINSAIGMDLTNVDSVIISNNYFLGTTQGITLTSGTRQTISGNIFDASSETTNPVPITFTNVGGISAAGGTVTGNTFTGQLTPPIRLAGSTNYIYIAANNCYEAPACVDISGLSAGYTSNVIGFNNVSGANTTSSASFSDGTAGDTVLRLRGTGAHQVAFDYPGAASRTTLNVDGVGNTSLIGGSGTFTIGPNVSLTGIVTLDAGNVPQTATAGCNTGQRSFDVTYTYLCVAPNSWHRISNGAAW